MYSASKRAFTRCGYEATRTNTAVNNDWMFFLLFSDFSLYSELIILSPFLFLYIQYSTFNSAITFLEYYINPSSVSKSEFDFSDALPPRRIVMIATPSVASVMIDWPIVAIISIFNVFNAFWVGNHDAYRNKQIWCFEKNKRERERERENWEIKRSVSRVSSRVLSHSYMYTFATYYTYNILLRSFFYSDRKSLARKRLTLEDSNGPMETHLSSHSWWLAVLSWFNLVFSLPFLSYDNILLAIQTRRETNKFKYILNYAGE